MPERGGATAPSRWERVLRTLRRRRFRVADESMAPTLRPGDRLYVDPGAYRGRAPEIGEIVVVHDPEVGERLLVKRIAGGGPPGAVVLAGDDPRTSRDSRSFGAVSTTLVVGRVYRCYAPPDRRRRFEPL